MANLIVYYSRTGQNYYDGEIRSLDKGNTEIVAEFIQEAVGGDLFQIETVKEYSQDYMECIDEAKAELRADARPDIKAYLDSLDGYDKIYVGYPNWWGTCPMCIFTLLDRYDLAGKQILPFCTNEGSGLGRSVDDLLDRYPEAMIGRGLSVTGHRAAQSKDQAAAWARKFR